MAGYGMLIEDIFYGVLYRMNARVVLYKLQDKKTQMKAMELTVIQAFNCRSAGEFLSCSLTIFFVLCVLLIVSM